MIKTSIVADSVHLSLVRSLFNEAKKYDDVIDFTLGTPTCSRIRPSRMLPVRLSSRGRPVSEDIASRILCLPSYFTLAIEDIERISSIIVHTIR